MKTIKKQFLVLLTIIATGWVTMAQQDPHYTQYMYNMNVINPAYAGSAGTLNIGFLARQQWVGIDGAPKTLTGTIHAPFSERLGAGLTIIHDEIGPNNENNVYVDLSYKVRLTEKANLSFGLKGGVTTLSQNLNGLQINDQNEQFRVLNEAYPNFGAGLFYHSQKFYAGVSIPNFLRTFHLESKNVNFNDSEAREESHLFLTSGYVFHLGENVKLKPALFSKITTGAPISVDFSANALFNDFFEVGLAYRFEDSIDAMVGFQINKRWRIGYAYDYTLSELQDFNNGSHEIMMFYSIDLSRDDLKSPRFF